MFPLGQTVATPAALAALAEAGISPTILLFRHQGGDWGEIPPEDQGLNEQALAEGLQLMSVYPLKTGEVIWVITEWDRSVTTLLLPQDY